MQDIQFNLNSAPSSGSKSDDSVSAIICAGEALAGLAVGKAVAFFSLKDAVDLGFTETYDTQKKTNVYSEIKDFYDKAGDGTELWFMLTTKVTSMADVCDKTKDLARKLIVTAGGRIKRLGISLSKEDGYTPTLTEGIDQDVFDAMLKAHEMSEDLALSQYMPSRIILGGRNFTGDVSILKNLKQCSQNRVGICLEGNATGKEAKVGRVLGWKAKHSVQRNIGRVASGDLGISKAYLSDNSEVESIMDKYSILADKGYIFPIKRAHKEGRFYKDDPMCASDDYGSWANGEVVDKVMRLSYQYYLNFVNDDYDLDPAGNISAGEIKRLELGMKKIIDAQMTSAGELSSFSVTVPLEQPVKGKTQISLKPQPRGYHKQIVIDVEYSQTQE